jgi:hypothetical protein
MGVNGRDPFLAMVEACLTGASFDALQTLNNELSPEITLGDVFNKAKEVFLYIIDEAQQAGRQYTHAFADGEGNNSRPVLRAIIRYLVPFRFCRIIISGTGFSHKHFETVVISATGRDPRQWSTEHDVGDFGDREKQMAYVSAYLPPKFLCSKSGKLLQQRIYDWLRGRYDKG